MLTTNENGNHIRQHCDMEVEQPAAPITRRIEIAYDGDTVKALLKGADRALVFKDADGAEILTRLAVILQRGMA